MAAERFETFLRFLEYHLAQFDSAAALALQKGLPATIFRHYRELVKSNDTGRFWNIPPAAEAENVVQFGVTA